MRFFLTALLILSLLVGKSLQKVFCIHLDSKKVHVETVQICESPYEIHIGIDKAFSQDEKFKFSFPIKAQAITFVLSPLKFSFSFLFKRTELVSFPIFLKTVRITT